jgi:hypothetical protein
LECFTRWDPGPGAFAAEIARPRIRVTIDFSSYKEYKLHPIKDVEILDTFNETGDLSTFVAVFGELTLYQSTIERDWRVREGGILWALADYNSFFNCITHYHSVHKTTNIRGWDELFEELQNSSYRKNILPCMVSSPI